MGPVKSDLNHRFARNFRSNLGADFSPQIDPISGSDARNQAVARGFSDPVLREILPPPATCRVDDDAVALREIGGGAFPGVVLPGWGVAVRPTIGTVTALEESLRKGDIPVLARIRHDALILSVRTLCDEEFSDIVRAMKSVLQS